MAREERVKQRKAHESSFNRKVGLVAGLLVLVPVLLRLTGRAAWWLPTWLDRLLPKVNFAHG